MNDLISRQAAIEALTGWETEPLDEDIVRTLNNLPPVTPTEQQKHGRLIDADFLLKETFTVDEEEWTTPEIRAILENAPSVTPTKPQKFNRPVTEILDECGIEWEYSDNPEELKRTVEIFDDAFFEAFGPRPSVTPTEQNEKDILKFYYVESLDEYWIGQRCGTRYYGKWTGSCFTFGYSRYLPWGEHVVAPDTLWKEHTYPSEPKEIPFNEWLQGFLEKERQTERTGEWKHDGSDWENRWVCSECGYKLFEEQTNYCPNCGAKMKG